MRQGATANAPAGRLYAVLADDLTGASDVGLQFAAAGLRTSALFGRWSAIDTAGLDVVVVDTGTRVLPGDEAASRVRALYRQIHAAGGSLIFKKIDSTLRGNLGVEIDTLLGLGEFRRAIVCPAFPAQGRTLAGGTLLVAGRPVAQSAAGRDPVAPVAESHLPTLLARQTQRPVRHLPLAIVTAGAGALAAVLESHGEAGEVVVCDATSDPDLATIVAAAAAAAGHSLLVGSAGLAQPLAMQLAAGHKAPVLVVCGSLHPVARRQVAALAGASRHVELDIAAAQAGGDAWQRWLAQLRQGLEAAEDAGRPLLLTTPATAGPDALGYATRLAEAALAVSLARRLAGIAVTGGDTLAALLAVWKAAGIDIDGALAPGIPIGRIRGGQLAGMPIVTKAGGFGAPDLLVAAVRVLSRTEERRI
jgi:D-threonate/D-erythronate kinase